MAGVSISRRCLSEIDRAALNSSLSPRSRSVNQSSGFRAPPLPFAPPPHQPSCMWCVSGTLYLLYFVLCDTRYIMDTSINHVLLYPQRGEPLAATHNDVYSPPRGYQHCPLTGDQSNILINQSMLKISNYYHTVRVSNPNVNDLWAALAPPTGDLYIPLFSFYVSFSVEIKKILMGLTRRGPSFPLHTVIQ